LLVHHDGCSNIVANIPASYSLQKYYLYFAYFGMLSWVSNMIFHTRDVKAIEELDYFAAGASVLYGLHYTAIRVLRLDLGESKTRSLLRAWTVLCICMFVAHVTYLKMYKFDYRYNVAAKVVIGVVRVRCGAFLVIKNTSGQEGCERCGRDWRLRG
jgi:hypothetical protein